MASRQRMARQQRLWSAPKLARMVIPRLNPGESSEVSVRIALAVSACASAKFTIVRSRRRIRLTLIASG